MLYSRGVEGDAVPAAGTDDMDTAETVVVARAVSRKRTVMAEVNGEGYVVGLRLLDDAVRDWDVATLEDRVKAVASVAHDRYLAALDATDGTYPTMEAVADAEMELDF